MYRRILIPVTRPNEVEPMIRFATALLEADGDIRVLHVIPTTTMPEVTRQWRESVNLVIPAHETGAALDVRVEPEVRASVDVPAEILDSAESHSIDVILMTLGGSRKSRNPFVGHVSTSILHHAGCDVIIVNRLALVENRVPRILLPSFGPQPPPKLLHLAEEIALRHQGAPIVTLRIGRKEADAGEEGPTRSPRGLPMRERRSFISDALLGRRRLPELILNQAARERYGLLLVGEESQHLESQLLTRRFLEELFRAAPCPVLALRG
ncbi:MAG TPA: universal stress protein [Thermoplasmata archaeon]|nr:universal stress protein [Thermoplasmata archaeon]